MPRRYKHACTLALKLGLRLGQALVLIAAMAGVTRAQPTDQDMTVTKRAATGETFALGRTPLTITLDLDDRLCRAIREAAEANLPAKGVPTIRLRVSGLRPSQDAWASGGRVFLNLPDEPEKLDTDLLSYKSPYYVGSFSFFPASGKEQSYYLSPGPAFKRLSQRRELEKDQRLTLTFVGIPRRDREGHFGSDGISVPFSEVSLSAVPPRSD